jgi:hypothetical protein
MIDRHWVGDLSLAVLLALPLAALALPQTSLHKAAPAHVAGSASLAGDLAAHGRIGLLG